MAASNRSSTGATARGGLTFEQLVLRLVAALMFLALVVMGVELAQLRGQVHRLDGSAGGAAPTGAAATSAETRSLEIVLKDLEVVPRSVEVPAGTRVTLNVVNRGAVPHNLTIHGGPKTPDLAQGEKATLDLGTVSATMTGACSVPGHKEAGMTFEVRVTGEAPAASSGSSAGAPTAAHTMDAAAMDRMHEAVVKAFPASTGRVGGQVLSPSVAGGIKTFDLTTEAVRWEVAPGKVVDAFAYNGQIPGPQIRVRQGDHVRVRVHNRLPESTAVHFHGLTVPNAMDGVPFITQPPIRPGETFTYEFTVVEPPGSYMYHSHHNATAQVGKGLLGAFVVEPAATARGWDVEQAVVLGDGELGYTINGKGFPATAPVTAKRGQRVLLRFMNAGGQLHPMHLHGFHFRVVARDGRPVTPYVVDTLTVGPGERYDALFVADTPGVWAFHCHILPHAESDQGMHGMVTALVVK